MEELKGLDDSIITSNQINMKLINDKKLIKSGKLDRYSIIQAFYRKAFDLYIKSLIDVKKYDDMIENSGLDFTVIPDDRKSIYHYVSSLDLKYIYVRNFLFIEKLSLEYLNIFIDKIKKDDYVVDDSILDVVKRTYKDVIKDNCIHGEYKELTTACYGAWTEENLVSSNNLVLCIHYGLNSKQLEMDEFIKNSLEKKEFLKKLISEMETDFEEKLGVVTTILVRNYNGE